LTVLRAYIAAGKPGQGLAPYGRFEQWSDLIRAALVWLGCEDPCESRRALLDEDPVNAGIATVVAAWEACLGTGPFTTAEVMSGVYQSERQALKQALEAVLPQVDINARALGYWLRKHKDRVTDGCAFRQAAGDPHTKVARWCMRRCG
jgi:putative DNA primase/helicase